MELEKGVEENDLRRKTQGAEVRIKVSEIFDKG
jgi:hypothetical protein